MTSLQKRFEDIEENQYTDISTLLDPSFKNKFFTGSVQRENVKMLLRENFDEMATSNRKASENRSNHPGESESEPSPKRRKNEIWDAFTEIIEESEQTFLKMTKLKNTCLSNSLTSIGVIVSHGGLIS